MDEIENTVSETEEPAEINLAGINNDITKEEIARLIESIQGNRQRRIQLIKEIVEMEEMEEFSMNKGLVRLRIALLAANEVDPFDFPRSRIVPAAHHTTNSSNHLAEKGDSL